jgi:hypothetical protein
MAANLAIVPVPKEVEVYELAPFGLAEALSTISSQEFH